MSQGWICVHRKLLDWEWFDDHNTFRLFMYFMLKANHQDKNWKGIAIKRGQHLTSLDKIVAGSGLTKSQIRTSINKLKSTQEIAHSSNAQHTVITIINYDLYQASDTHVSTPVTHESHTNDTPMTPNNNDNNDNNENNKSPTPKKAPPKKNKTKFPDDFAITQKMFDWFVSKEFDIDLEQATEKWVLSMQAGGYSYVDWGKAWMNGMIKAQEWRNK